VRRCDTDDPGNLLRGPGDDDRRRSVAVEAGVVLEHEQVRGLREDVRRPGDRDQIADERGGRAHEARARSM